MRNTSILRYLLIGMLVLILVTLAAWYVFIQGKQGEVERDAAARGAGLPQQSFTGRLGSTYENIASNISSTFTQQNEDEAAGKNAPSLAQITKTPVAGAQFVETDSGTRLRFVERSTGHVFDVDPTTHSIERLTNTLVPLTYEALITDNDRFIFRSLDEDGEIATFAAMLGTTTEEGLYPLELARLPDGLRDIAVDPMGDEFFYVAKTDAGGVGIRSAWDASEQSQIFSSTLADWRIFRLNDERTLIVQSPADDIVGYAFEVAPGGNLSPIIRNVPGLLIGPYASSTALLYSSSSASGVSLFARIDDNASALQLPIRTIADKCVWSMRETGIAFCATPQNQAPVGFLDRWYRGEMHTTDAWWRIDIRSSEAAQLFSSGSTAIDVGSPTIDASSTYIAFMNAADKSLWMLRIPYE